MTARRATVELLYFDGCPNSEAPRTLVDRVGRELGIGSELRMVEVGEEKVGRRLRFVGFPDEQWLRDALQRTRED